MVENNNSVEILEDFDKELLKQGVTAIATLVEQSSVMDKLRLENQSKEIDNMIILKELDLKELELRQKNSTDMREHVKGFDVRNKIYSIVLLSMILILAIILQKFTIIDKSASATLIMVVVGGILNSNKDFLGKVFNRKE
ncbi:hypothetical protein [Flavobacterium praedii]|uniref:hypothetical protein n=1 Tax=Flavobacterium praedii TaxID=3002900 RepID=UPI002481C863|nr:hypothetical protein [Flavobacterium praedii]